MYTENCGLDSLLMAWGHDEYMYRVCKGNRCRLPEVALYIIRYHSFYAHHTARSYDQFLSEKDKRYLPYLQKFQKYDLYSKKHDLQDAVVVKAYYQKLIEKYFPDVRLRF
eukprot:TRINITY_DN7661_c0_g1_i3.p2 TRINITY_DN7661_c0_g1~~TRINITY_DN7661_c0_g1_i3.p2  ORF type:complete len:110 (-),score=2.55 TRINITY_DN7661_c0_g1_i3:99-428(-)